jgi:hypothetical protein
MEALGCARLAMGRRCQRRLKTARLTPIESCAVQGASLVVASSLCLVVAGRELLPIKASDYSSIGIV